MYLKSLDLQGFKSFPDKIRLQFDGAITAIVGPNGSGKSNISDAIRWVMGEQSSKSLRGVKMEDVIFGGTLKRPQLGFAEASLVFDNSDRYFAIDSDEVMVTRRFYRSGENEFYINKQSVRLRDVNELFMDTGLGKEGYSNISQGRIDEILAVKSTDRREIFEEAAGISKYRHRKEETERRLERTEDNLLRINDKISELELQVGPLREQSEKAQKYLALRDELKGQEVALWLHSLESLAAAAKKAEEDYNAAAFILNQEHENLDALYRRSESLNAELRERDTETELRREQISEAEAELQRIASRTDVLEGEKRNAGENLSRLRQELSDEDNRRGDLRAQIQERRSRLGAIDVETRDLELRLAEIRRELDELTASTEGMNRSYLELRNRHAACVADLAAKRADIAALMEALERSREREKELCSDRDAAQARRDETEEKLSACRKALSAAREEADGCKNTLDGYALRQKTREEKAAQLRQELQDCGVKLDTANSRLHLFREMEREYEGFSKAVKFVMQQAEAGSLRNIHGPVSRLIQTDDRYSVALEIALGSAMQHVVVSAEEDAKQAIQQLKLRDVGRATFLPLSAMEGRVLQEQGVENCRGFVGIASALVRFDERYRPVVENLLGRTVITENLDDAIAMARRYKNRFKIVTLDGQVMNAGGSMTGGSVSRSAGVLSRANEISRLEAQIAKLIAQKEELARQSAEANRQLDLAGYEQTTVQAKLREFEDQILRLEGEEKQYSVLFDAINQAGAGNQREIDTLTAQIGTDERRRDALRRESETLEAKEKELSASIDALSVDQNALNQEGSGLTDELTEKKMAVAGLNAEKLTAMENLRRLEELAAAMEGDRSQKQELIDDLESQMRSLEDRIAENQKLLEEQTAKTEVLRTAHREALEHRNELEAQRTAADRDAQQKNKDILDLERECARLEAKKNTSHLEEKQIVDKLWDSYELTPSTAPAQAAVLESVAAANRKVAELRRKLHGLGTPNLGAIEEFERVNERYTYLSGQRDDVMQSKRDLEGIIRDITKQMTEIFVSEFTRINRYFGETFVEMFGGGRASLELEDPNDPLACGIEIKVQPPGKQLKTITLLSGGEKAFVAIALYFSILKVRPTPFCMLDEIDAALDDRNVERFANYLRQLCAKTQFIVITHRRGTMEEADALFGVTMQEQGVSKILHLDLDELEKELGLGQQ
ncbi:MAG: chromosome segregation protein SMC [Clostridia bacterium]|nr:chromosome segregation protein SMC [Clostridia bacterium]